MPRQRPSATNSWPPGSTASGTTSAIVQWNSAPRCGRRMSLSWSSSRRTFASSPAADPAHLAEKMPGAPPSTSTVMPESSASAIRPVCCRRRTRLDERVLGEGHALLDGLGAVVRQHDRLRHPLADDALELAHLVRVVAREHELQASRAGRLGAGGERRHLQSRELGGAGEREVEQRVELAAVERARPPPCPAPRRTARGPWRRRSCRSRRARPRRRRGRASACRR